MFCLKSTIEKSISYFFFAGYFWFKLVADNDPDSVDGSSHKKGKNPSI